MKKRVLFLCTGNSCRSQMAEGWLRHVGGASFEAASAGTEPAGLNPTAVKVMGEAGVDISGHRSKHVKEFEGQSFDWVITVCDMARRSCPVFPGAGNALHQAFDDPAGQGESEFRRVREEIGAWIRRFAGTEPAGEC